VKYTDAIRVDASTGIAEGTLFVDPAADYLRDHFPGAPTLPGLVMLEAAVRVAASMWAARPSGGPWPMLEHIDRLLVVRRVVPGETLVVRVELVDDSSHGGASFKAEAAVAAETAMRARFRLGNPMAGAGC
jgi:3-hydroxymyristoyl/3-hydroxydecanoyl-(acyl carrier protein) dehydratase